MLRRALSLVALASWSGLAHAQGPPPIRDGAFVTTAEHRFTLDERSFHVIGANVATMHGNDHREAMSETLEAAARDGLSVVRVWALGEYPADAPSWVRNYAFRIGPEGWVEDSYVHLDRVLARARSLGLRVIVVFANRWGDYGGVTQYLRWAGIESPTASVQPGGLTAFYESELCESYYRAHVRRILTRTNSVTGVRYVDDPTVFAWELINEAEAATSVGEAMMLQWMERQSRFVHDLDPNHMVSAGHIGYDRLRDRSLWREVCALEGVDYCDSHAYPISSGRVRNLSHLARWIDDRVQLAQYVVGKPLLFGEIGVRTDRRAMHGRDRVAWLNAFLSRVLDDGAAGAMLWTYLPSDGDRRTYGVYVEGARARQTMDVRRAWSSSARTARRRIPRSINARLSPERGETPIFDPTVRLRGPAVTHRNWQYEGTTASVRVDALAFERAQFEATGVWPGEPGLPHFYGSGAGYVTYLVARPRSDAATSLRVRMRASSELPGGGQGASTTDTSTLTVSIDGIPIGTATAPADDGVGAWVEVVLEDRALLDRLGRRPRWKLRIDAGADDGGGVCVYGRTERGEPAGIELIWESPTLDSAAVN